MSTWGEEETSDPRAEANRLREALREQERRADAAERAAREWRAKVAAVAENYHRRIRQLRAWTERLGRERSALERERARLARENERVRAERDDLSERVCNLRCEAVLGFLGTALESPIDRDRLGPLVCDGDRHRTVLSLLPGERGLAARIG